MIPKASILDRIRHWFRIRFYGTKLVSAHKGLGGYQLWVGRYGLIYAKHVRALFWAANELRLDVFRHICQYDRYESIDAIADMLDILGYECSDPVTLGSGIYRLAVIDRETGILEEFTVYEEVDSYWDETYFVINDLEGEDSRVIFGNPYSGFPFEED